MTIHEILSKESKPLETPKKSRVCELLRVEINEVFEYDGNLYYVSGSGEFVQYSKPTYIASKEVPLGMIEHPEKIRKLVPINELKGINENEKNN